MRLTPVDLLALDGLVSTCVISHWMNAMDKLREILSTIPCSSLVPASAVPDNRCQKWDAVVSGVDEPVCGVSSVMTAVELDVCFCSSLA